MIWAYSGLITIHQQQGNTEATHILQRMQWMQVTSAMQDRRQREVCISTWPHIQGRVEGFKQVNQIWWTKLYTKNQLCLPYVQAGAWDAAGHMRLWITWIVSCKKTLALQRWLLKQPMNKSHFRSHLVLWKRAGYMPASWSLHATVFGACNPT